MSSRKWVVLLLVLGFFLIFFRLTRHDVLQDDGHIALRALGYFDYMASEEQTTPVQWFGERPAWSYLSFHDHPPLFFLIQHVFFKIFGDSVFVSRFPTALAGFGTLIILYYLAKMLSPKREFHLLALGLGVLNNYLIWIFRVGLLEGIFIFFFLLGLLAFLRALRQNPKSFRWAGLLWGLAMLTKYTILFVWPAVFLFLLFRRRDVFKNRQFWYGVLILLVVLVPIIIYNIGMYQSRGHFDLNFSEFFDQDRSDWAKVADRLADARFGVGNVAAVLGGSLSWPYFVLMVGGLLLGLYRAVKQKDEVVLLLVLIFLSLAGSFTYVGSPERWVSVMAPLAGIFAAYFFWFLWQQVSDNKFRYAWLAMCAVLSLYFLIYTFGTNHAKKVKLEAVFSRELRIENLGYNQLEKTLARFFENKRANDRMEHGVKEVWFTDIKPEALDFPRIKQGQDQLETLIVFDDEMPWFATAWIFERRKLYQRIFAATGYEFLDLISHNSLPTVINYMGVNGIYFIQTTPVSQGTTKESDTTKYLLERFKEMKIEPEVIKNGKGQDAFYIYSGVF